MWYLTQKELHMQTHLMNIDHPETDEDIVVEIHYEYFKGEPQTNDCPGEDEHIEIYKIIHNGVDIIESFDTHGIIDLEDELMENFKDQCDGPDEPDFDGDAADRMADEYFDRYYDR